MSKNPLRMVCLVAFCLAVTLLVPAGGFAAEKPATTVTGVPAAATTVTGVPAALSRPASSAASFTVSVTPAKGREVMLQQYDSAKDRWRTRAKYRVGGQDRGTVKVRLAKKYRKRTTGQWRVYVPATEQAAEAASRVCTVTTRNIRTKKLSARSACVYCIDTGKLIYTKKHTARRSPASTTKLMSAIVMTESGKLNGTTRISAKAARTPWGSGRLRKGDVYRNIDLLYAMLLPSSNDAAVAVAEGVSGSAGAFVARMNRKARSMGLKKTRFRNPHGLNDKKHYTTAAELARITACAYGDDDIRKAMKTKKRTIKSLRYHRKWTLRSSDSLLGKIRNFFGGKTGTGSDARFCFAGVYKYKGKTYVTVVLGAKSGAGRWRDTRKLQSYIRKYAEKKY